MKKNKIKKVLTVVSLVVLVSVGTKTIPALCHPVIGPPGIVIFK